MLNIPCDSEQDVMHQVLAAVANGAGLEAVAVTGGASEEGGRENSDSSNIPQSDL